MAIILTPLTGPPAGQISCSDLIVIGPEDAKNAYDCPIVMKTRTVLVVRGQEATIEWEMRDKNGSPVDLTACLGMAKIRLQEALGVCLEVTEILGTVPTPTNGIVRFDLTSSLVANAGIYMMQIGIYNTSDKLVFSNTGFLSIERGLFDANPENSYGPITIGEIRIQMRDILLSNDLRDAVEFDDTEIVHSIVQPIMYWNEVPPPVAIFTPLNFPFRYHWLRGTCANLLRISATWYLRNKLKVTHGGAQDDDRDRDREYMILGQLYDKEWKEFVDAKKVEINLARCWGSFA